MFAKGAESCTTNPVPYAPVVKLKWIVQIAKEMEWLQSPRPVKHAMDKEVIGRRNREELSIPERGVLEKGLPEKYDWRKDG